MSLTSLNFGFFFLSYQNLYMAPVQVKTSIHDILLWKHRESIESGQIEIKVCFGFSLTDFLKSYLHRKRNVINL